MNRNSLSLAALSSLMLLSLPAAADETVVWEESFDKNGQLSQLGWTAERQFEKDNFVVEDGRLQATCEFNPYKGSLYSRRIPFVKQGYIAWEAKSNGAGYNHLSLQVKFYDVLTSYTGLANGSWCRHYSWGKTDDWKTVGDVPRKGANWVKYKVAFDVDAKTMEYYIDDMENPVRIDTDVMLAPEKDGKSTLKIGNYGLANGSILNEVDNIRLVSITGQRSDAKIENTAIVFRGIAFGSYQLDRILEELKVSGSTNYDLETYGAALSPTNQFRLSKKPHPRPSSLPRYIIMADMPLGEVVPEYVQKVILHSVDRGATLLVLGGLFTLNKGEFQGALLGKAMPVEIGSPWTMKRLDAGEKIDGASAGDGRVRFLHDLKLKKDARILAKAGDHVFMAARNHGKGRILVCLGMPCGEYSNDEVPFWEWDKWPEFVAAMMNEE
ncbi:MAG: hypothetical protein GXY38_09650 [Planctomycetes bacterium]|nr:hypothetical protein [Planctomycetota bacterium]